MKFRQFAFFIVLILVGLLVVRSFGKFGQLVELLRNVNIAVLFLLLPARYMYYWSNTRYYEHFFQIFKRKVAFRDLFGSVLSMNFVNTVIPSAGLSGATYFAHRLEDKVTARESYLAQFFWYMATFLSIVLVLLLSFIVLFFSNSIAQMSFRITLIVMSFLLFAALGIAAITLNQTIFHRVLYILTRPINWVLKILKRPAIGSKQIQSFVDGFNDLVVIFLKHPHKAVRVFFDALLCVFAEVLSISIVFLAFGQFVNPGVIGAAYIFALLLSVLSIFTAGVGVYEATMVGVFVALGLPFSLAFSVTALYRIVALWLFLPVGLYFYKKQTIDEVKS